MAANGKKTLAVVSGSLQAANAVSGFFHSKAPEYKIVNYLDGYIIRRYASEGHVTDRTMQRVLKLIETACNDGADAVMLTCTAFGDYQNVFYSLFKAPVFCAQDAMMETLSKCSGKKALFVNHDEAVETVKNMYEGICRRNNVSAKVEIYEFPDPYSDDSGVSLAEWKNMVLRRLSEVDGKFDCIGLAQSPMAELADNLPMRHAQVFTTTSCALEVLNRKMRTEQL